MIPQVNATLTKVTGEATSEDWDAPAGAGTVLWAGSEPVYYRETRERTTGNQSDLIVIRTLIVDTNLRTWTEGEQVTFQPEGQPIQTAAVRLIETRRLPGHPLETTRLTLNP